MLMSEGGDFNAGAGKLRVGGGRQRLVGLHSGSGQRLARQIEPADARVLVDITQDVSELERAAEMMSKRHAGFVRQAENAHREPADSGRDPIAVKVERRPVRSADVLLGVHRHAINHGVEICMAQMKAARHVGEGGEMRLRLSSEHCSNVSAPLLQLGQALSRARRPTVISDIVDCAAEAVDGEHRLALLRRQNAHGGIKNELCAAGSTCELMRPPSPAASRAHHRRAKKTRRAEPAD